MRVAIYGIGNTLLGDDGIGPAVAHFLDDHFFFPEEVVVEDLGTPSLDLPGYLFAFDTVIFLDAVALDAPPGTIRTFSRAEITAVAPGIHLSPHELSINDALTVLDFAGCAPRDVILVGVVPHTLDGGMCLSPSVAESVTLAAGVVLEELGRRGILVRKQAAALVA